MIIESIGLGSLALGLGLGALKVSSSTLAPAYERALTSVGWEYRASLSPSAEAAMQVLEALEPYTKRTAILATGKLCLFEHLAPASALSGAATFSLESSKTFKSTLLITSTLSPTKFSDAYKEIGFPSGLLRVFTTSPEKAKYALTARVCELLEDLQLSLDAPISVLIHRNTICLQVLKPSAVENLQWLEVLIQKLMNLEDGLSSFS